MREYLTQLQYPISFLTSLDFTNLQRSLLARSSFGLSTTQAQTQIHPGWWDLFISTFTSNNALEHSLFAMTPREGSKPRKKQGYWTEPGMARKFLDDFANANGLTQCIEDWDKVTHRDIINAGVSCMAL